MAEATDHKITTVIIDDSGLMRIMLSDALKSDPMITVLGTASNGKDGVEKVRQLNPDVVITDMIMPNYDGLYVVETIMAENPKPVLLLSSLNKTNAEVFDALKAGAVDFIDKPVNNGSNSFQRSVNILTTKIKMASSMNTKVVTVSPKKNNHDHTFSDKLNYDAIAIGASTGGPSAIEYILGKLPVNLNIPVVIAQHMPDRFITSFCDRLSGVIPLKVQVAHDNEEVESGVVYLAPGTANLTVSSLQGKVRFHYTSRKYKEFNNPSVDCLFESMAEVYGSRLIAAILTGMGKDGARGIKKIRESGGVTIAQDDDSCVVNGMPGAAAELKAIDYTVKLHDIPGFIVNCF